MEGILKQLNAVPGVVGSLVADGEGNVLARAFPPEFNTTLLQEAARALAESTAGFETVTGIPGMIDFRFAESRVLAKTIARPGTTPVILLLFCARKVNVALLQILTNVAESKLASLPSSPSRGHAASSGRGAAPGSAPGDVYSDAEMLRKMLESLK